MNLTDPAELTYYRSLRSIDAWPGSQKLELTNLTVINRFTDAVDCAYPFIL